MRRIIQRLRDEKAMSIVEILVSFLILSLIAMAIMPGLFIGYKQIREAGNKSTKVFEVQEALEKELVVEPDDDLVTISIKFGDITLEVEGSIIAKEEAYDTNGNKTEAKVFIPKQ